MPGRRRLDVLTVSECCLIKLLPYILFEKCINILALEMASPGNRHCANCIIGTFSFRLEFYAVVMLLTFILIIISIPSPRQSFIPGLKHSFSANPSHRSLPFLLQD